MPKIIDKQERYRRANLKDGLVQIKIWIPEESRDKIVELAENLRTIARNRRLAEAETARKAVPSPAKTRKQVTR
jgi:hypothetical protein